MGIEEQVTNELHVAVQNLVRRGALPPEVRGAALSVDKPKRPEHGDLATNAALAMQKQAKMKPRDIAELIAAELRQSPDIDGCEIAGPGFINLRVSAAAHRAILREVLLRGRAYGRGAAATGQRIQVEFVSANPTGPLLISHGRGAIVGDGIARLLEAAGHRVSREYYVNDFGNQVRLFARSVKNAIAGEAPPEGGYGGAYVKEVADWLAKNEPAALDGDEAALGRLCITRVLDGVPGSSELPGIKNTLKYLGVQFDAWFSEESLHRWGRVSAALAVLEQQGHLYEEQGAQFFKAEDFGDEKNRVVKKGDGLYTYFASDIAYHRDKYERGYDHLLVVLGADHHGYEPRVRAAIRALGYDDTRFEVQLLQLVSLLRDGVMQKIGKRLGNYITVEEVVDEIDEAAQRRGAGADALRYFYLSRRTSQPVDLDIEIAKRASLDNPVFYLQMGYARLCSIQRRAAEVFGLEVPPYGDALAARVAHPDELAILAQLGRFPALIAQAAAERAPHLVVFYLTELSRQFQSYFTRLKKEGDAILPLSGQMAEDGWQARWDKDKTLARLLWVKAIQTVYRAGLEILGITALERMEPLGGDAEEREEA